MDSVDLEKPGSGVHPHGHVRQRTIAIVLLVLLTASITSMFLAVYINRDTHNGSGHQELDQTCDDIAVIGAGIAGSYAAWRLRDRNLSITVYEYSDRVGGRMHTVHFADTPSINIELGAMRFIPKIHPRMTKAASDLGLSVIEFKQGIGFDVDTLMYTRGVHFSRGDATINGPYHLKPSERQMDELHLRWSLFVNGTDYTVGQTLSSADARQFIKTEDGDDLYKQSSCGAYAKMGVSHEAIIMLRDTYGFHCYFCDVVAYLGIPARNPVTGGNLPPIKTIASGMHHLPQAMIDAFINLSPRHHLVKNHGLQKIRRLNNGAFELKFQRTLTADGTTAYSDYSNATVSKCAKKVVLAIPKLALQHLDWEGIQNIGVKRLLDSAFKDSPAAKVFLVYDTPWWRSLNLQTGHSISDLPNRQTYDFGTESNASRTNRSVLLAVYTDMQDVKFWREAQHVGMSFNCTTKHFTQANCVSTAVVKYAHAFLSDIYNISVEMIPDPVDGAISLWDAYPYGAGWHVWYPGYISSKVHERMTQPVRGDNVFVASGMLTSGDGDAWAESALHSVDSLLKKL